MYTANLLHVRIKNKLTQTVEQHVGVRQGENLSPNLFKNYVNDLPSCFDANDDQVILHDSLISCLVMDADDLVLLSTSVMNVIFIFYPLVVQDQ